jgi:ribosome biogenesis GTPase / thiamine phosphate phosphatase
MKALVVKSTGSWYTVQAEDEESYKCRIKGKFRTKDIKSTNPIVVGDNVEIIFDSNSWMINKLYSRTNYIIRKSVNLSKQTHIIAANIDQAILMITLKSPITTTGFIDRFLVSAKAYGVDVILFFNKYDIYDDDTIFDLHKLIEIYRNIGYKCFSISALRDDMSEIKTVLKDKNNLISGHSGVGKSTLINKLLSSDHIVTKEISTSHDQGKHTTTFSELYRLDFGGTIIDTPGIKGFGLVEIDINKLDNYFPEIFKYKSECKFHNCLHKNEPDCMVKDAVENGLINKERYINYLSMLESEQSIYRTKDH